jgi:hypothetical protein
VPDPVEAAPPKPRRRGWLSILAVCAVGVLAVSAIATIHPWWGGSSAAPTFTLKTLNVTFVGSGAGSVKADDLCELKCPAKLSAGTSGLIGFTVTPDATIRGCDPSPYFTITKVTEVTTGGAFPLASVTADSQQALPVTIPNPLNPGNGGTCVTTAEVWLTLTVVDQGPATQSPAFKVTVTKS